MTIRDGLYDDQVGRETILQIAIFIPHREAIMIETKNIIDAAFQKSKNYAFFKSEVREAEKNFPPIIWRLVHHFSIALVPVCSRKNQL